MRVIQPKNQPKGDRYSLIMITFSNHTHCHKYGQMYLACSAKYEQLVIPGGQ